MHSGREVGVTEIYLAAEPSSSYCIQYSVLFQNLCVIGLGVIIPEAEVYQGSDSAIAFGFHKHASFCGHTGPMEDTGVHLLVDPCLVFGHQRVWLFEGGCLQKLRLVYEAYPVHYLAYWGQSLRYLFDKSLGEHRQEVRYFLWLPHG